MSAPENGSVATDITRAFSSLAGVGMLTETAFDLSDPNLSFEDWGLLGEAFGRFRQASNWWIGDWYIFGEYRWGDKAAAKEHLTGVSPHRLATIVRTCMYVPKSRRHLRLPFSFHTEVVKLMPEEQTRFLDLAEEYRWTRDQLRESVRIAQQRFADEPPPKWQGAIVMRRQLDVEAVAKSILERATPLNDTHYQIERSLYEQLAAAFGEEK